MIKHHPLIGVGVSTFSTNYLKYKLPEPGYAMTGDKMYAHNIYLQMAGEVGLLGLAAFLWLLFNYFKFAFTQYRLIQVQLYKTCLLGIILCIIAFLINGLTETSLYYSRVAIIFWYLIGLSFGIRRICNENK